MGFLQYLQSISFLYFIFSLTVFLFSIFFILLHFCHTKQTKKLVEWWFVFWTLDVILGNVLNVSVDGTVRLIMTGCHKNV